MTLNLIADGDIATTALVRQALGATTRSEISPLYPRTVRYADLVSAPSVFSRFSDPDFEWLPRYLVEHGGRYAYYLDDDFWSLDPASPLGRHYAQPAVRRSLANFITAAAVVIASTKHLASQLSARFPSLRVVHIPAHFDFSLLRVESLQGEPSSTLRIGYAGGFRKEEFAMLTPALERVLVSGKATVEFIGSIPSELNNIAGVGFFPHLQDYGEYIRFKRSRKWDIGLAPLIESEFSRSKTNNKFREYGALAIAGVYSDVGPYRDSVINGADGILVDNTSDAWLGAISGLIDDPAKRRTLGLNAQAKIRGNWSLEVLAPRWRDVLDSAHLKPMESRVLGSAQFALRSRRYRAQRRSTAVVRRALGAVRGM